jgi:hypothetical protein
MPERTWKRPWLFILSLVLGGGFGALIWVFWAKEDSWAFAGLSALLVAASTLGLLVAVKGCNACVARLFGSV